MMMIIISRKALEYDDVSDTNQLVPLGQSQRTWIKRLGELEN